MPEKGILLKESYYGGKEYMDNSFEKNFEREQEIRRQYDAADSQGSEEGRAAARKAYQKFRDGIAAQGGVYAVIYRLYSQAGERGNKYIDLDYEVDGEEAGKLADAFRKYGIGRFTYSSGWSGAAEAAWQFIQHGCVLEGMAEISSGYKALDSSEYTKTHGYVFRV